MKASAGKHQDRQPLRFLPEVVCVSAIGLAVFEPWFGHHPRAG
ncbi:hypothetical protein J2T57_001271 [Natronocella acetinitrilica]|uniref:Uncharacterized protein n=1 Tax=Natronocella acetinitrilica TaxID=414046 RepID=A0AAE3G233_9GAMM|nr:hypothetical protein [Natronocella acetinitrilica]MCP1674169.1 hypothetical protein [Natronocella acetinitrilica]